MRAREFGFLKALSLTTAVVRHRSPTEGGGGSDGRFCGLTIQGNLALEGGGALTRARSLR